tara:strand:+ start:2459 stop:3178 length:720 start_codon:yes stop_codon:yes gene_type:complete
MEYYNILQIESNATQEEIKSAFRKLSLKFHPDKQSSHSNKYNKILEAYKYLSNLNQIIPYIETNNKVNDIYTTVTIELTDIYNDTSIPIEITRTITKQNNSIEESETLYIHICSGIDTNEIIIINNKGNIIENTQGDIKVKIIVHNNSIFKREGLNLILNKEITLKESLCGFEFNFTHINNEIYYIKNYNNIIYPAYQKILPQLGLKRDKIYGQLILKFTIIFPTQLSEKHKHILNTIL